MSFNFSDKVVLVVGGSSGIGRGITRAFLDAGAAVHVWGTRTSLSDYDDPCGLAGAVYAQVDVSDEYAVKTAANAIRTLDVLVLCQGTVFYDRQEFQIEQFRRVVEVNLNSMMTCAQNFYTKLRLAKGTIITVSSTAALRATRGNPAYNASKAGVAGLTRTLGQAWAHHGIRVNGIAPGYVDTKLTKVTTQNPDRMASALASIPIRRFGEPAEMAGAVLFLASSYASYIFGQTIVVDGGFSL